MLNATGSEYCLDYTKSLVSLTFPRNCVKCKEVGARSDRIIVDVKKFFCILTTTISRKLLRCARSKKCLGQPERKMIFSSIILRRNVATITIKECSET